MRYCRQGNPNQQPTITESKGCLLNNFQFMKHSNTSKRPTSSSLPVSTFLTPQLPRCLHLPPLTLGFTSKFFKQNTLGSPPLFSPPTFLYLLFSSLLVKFPLLHIYPTNCPDFLLGRLKPRRRAGQVRMSPRSWRQRADVEVG